MRRSAAAQSWIWHSLDFVQPQHLSADRHQRGHHASLVAFAANNHRPFAGSVLVAPLHEPSEGDTQVATLSG